ncbi:hypothetical protein GCM10020216_056990 [Nonomuraea helvata]
MVLTAAIKAVGGVPAIPGGVRAAPPDALPDRAGIGSSDPTIVNVAHDALADAPSSGVRGGAVRP